jgi:hypothetical protein
VEISHRQIDSQPLRMIGEHVVDVRLTVDLVPTITVIVHREGESVAAALEEAEMLAEAEAAGEPVELEYAESPEPPDEDQDIDTEAETEETEG